jgi:hypothetical protein
VKNDPVVAIAGVTGAIGAEFIEAASSADNAFGHGS